MHRITAEKHFFRIRGVLELLLFCHCFLWGMIRVDVISESKQWLGKGTGSMLASIERQVFTMHGRVWSPEWKTLGWVRWTNFLFCATWNAWEPCLDGVWVCVKDLVSVWEDSLILLKLELTIQTKLWAREDTVYLSAQDGSAFTLGMQCGWLQCFCLIELALCLPSFWC